MVRSAPRQYHGASALHVGRRAADRALEAGCDLITHCNITGPVAIPEATLELFVDRDVGAVIFPWTDKGLQWIREHVADSEWVMWESTDINARNLIRSWGVADVGERWRDLRARDALRSVNEQELGRSSGE